MMKSSGKPSGTVAAKHFDPKPLSSSTEDERYVRAKAQDEAKLERLRQATRDKIGEHLHAHMFTTLKMWPWLKGQFGNFMTVSRWYHEINTAIDTFKAIGPDEEKEIAEKRKMFKANGIRYAAVDHAMKFSDIDRQLKAA